MPGKREVPYTHKVRSECGGCPNRWVTSTGRCHDSCESYKKFQEELQKSKDEQYQQMLANGLEADKYEIMRAVKNKEARERARRYHISVHNKDL